MMSEPAMGEKYHVEAVLNLWNPSLDAVISSEQLGIVGTAIDVKNDLGYDDKSIREFRFVLRPGRKHKLRLAYTPVEFESDVLLHVYGDETRFRDPVSTAMVSKLDRLDVRSPIEALLPVFDRGQVAIITDGDAFLGLITRIDLLNYLRRRAQ